MAKIVTPAIRKLYKELLKQVVEDLHKPIVAYLPPEKKDCPNCHWDAQNQKSSGVFDNSFVGSVVIFGETISPQSFTRGRCPVCLGLGYLKKDVVKNLEALVKWNPKTGDEIKSLPAGRESSPLVRIKTLRTNFDTVIGAEHFLIDGVRCELNEPPTIRGLGTQEELVVAFLISVEIGNDVKK